MIFTTFCLAFLAGCKGPSASQVNLKECALQLLEEEYSYESIRDITYNSNGEVEIVADDDGSLSCDQAVQRLCEPGVILVGCGGSRSFYKIKRNEKGCEVVNIQTGIWDGLADCPTPEPTPTAEPTPTPIPSFAPTNTAEMVIDTTCELVIRAMAWIDVNADGFQETGEPPFPGVRFCMVGEDHCSEVSDESGYVNVVFMFGGDPVPRESLFSDLSCNLATDRVLSTGMLKNGRRFDVEPEIPSGYRLTTSGETHEFGFALTGTPRSSALVPYEDSGVSLFVGLLDVGRKK